MRGRLAFWLVVLVAAALPVRAGTIVNGNFETGDFSGWTLYTTSNGVLDPSIRLFDIDGTGSVSDAASFDVGQAVFTGFGDQQGGGLFQDIQTSSGVLNINADIAAQEIPVCCVNGDGGTFQLILDGTTVDTYSFGELNFGQPLYAELNASLSVSAGLHEIKFLVTRGAAVSEVVDLLDDVTATGSAVTPEPGSILLVGATLAIALVVLLVSSRFRRACAERIAWVRE